MVIITRMKPIQRIRHESNISFEIAVSIDYHVHSVQLGSKIEELEAFFVNIGVGLFVYISFNEE